MTHSTDLETLKQFEGRKVDHIHLSLDPNNQSSSNSDLNQIDLIHEALPDIDFQDVDLSTRSLGLELKTPFLISSMTAGHVGAIDLNQRLAKACEDRGWMMGVGSQRRELTDPLARKEWEKVRANAPNAKMLGNIGIAQLIKTPLEKIEELVSSLGAIGMIVHLNALQEVLQPEGTPQFRGGFRRIKELCETLSVPVIVKETGCGFSGHTLQRLNSISIRALDVSGLGGTHWGRIEGGRSKRDSMLSEASKTFKDWGVTTVESVNQAVELGPNFEVWASGGLRSGLDGAKMIAMGSHVVGFAKPLLEAALKSEQQLQLVMETIEYEFKMALFCTGCLNPQELRNKKVWKWRNQNL